MRPRRVVAGVVPVLLLLWLPAAFAPPRASAQDVVRVGEGDAALDHRLDRLLESGDYVLVTADTLIPGDAAVPTSLLVLDARATVEGAVHGDLLSVDGNVFLRPGATVAGDVVNLGGGFYPSALATVGGAVYDYPRLDYTVDRMPDGHRIVARSDEPRLALDGAFGFHVPVYNRVDGLRMAWGAAYRLPAVRGMQPRLHATAGYRTETGRASLGADVRVERGGGALVAGLERGTRTNDAWIRGDLTNSGDFLLQGDDLRDYYEADRLFAGLEWAGEWPGGRRLDARLLGQLEDAESLPAGDPFTLFGDAPYRPNPPVDDGTIASVLGGLGGQWVGRSSAIEALAELELAGGVLDGDLSFGRFELLGEWSMAALWDHVLEMEWYAQGPLPGTTRLPRQRWSLLGGSSTLNTRDDAEFRGDRVVYLETDYIIPLPERWALPILGSPDFEVLHRVGMAWTADLERDLIQNIGARLQFFSLFFRLLVEPARPGDSLDFDIGLSWPFGDDYPWRRGG